MEDDKVDKNIFEEWEKDFIYVMTKYGYKKSKPTQKVLEIVKFGITCEGDDLFNDIQSILTIPVKMMPEEVFLFIFEVIETLYNTKAEICNKYLVQMMNLLDDIPEFHDLLTCIFKLNGKHDKIVTYGDMLCMYTKEEFKIRKKLFNQRTFLSKSIPPSIQNQKMELVNSIPIIHQNTEQRPKQTVLFRSVRTNNKQHDLKKQKTSFHFSLRRSKENDNNSFVNISNTNRISNQNQGGILEMQRNIQQMGTRSQSSAIQILDRFNVATKEIKEEFEEEIREIKEMKVNDNNSFTNTNNTNRISDQNQGGILKIQRNIPQMGTRRSQSPVMYTLDCFNFITDQSEGELEEMKGGIEEVNENNTINTFNNLSGATGAIGKIKQNSQDCQIRGNK